jgi:ferredoxin/flavodoxin---NADP+ reductase
LPHIITRACCNDAACVPVCPVECIHPTPDEPDYGSAEMLYIDPTACIDCGACVAVCPVGAITTDDDLPEEYARFAEINARYFAGPDRHAQAATVPVDHPRPRREVSTGSLRVAIVGSGPAACYAAEELMGQRGLRCEVDIFERLPVPWGLVRFGVAPDHQDTKAASGAFAQTVRSTGCRLFLNTEVGRDISLAELRDRYHAVVYAIGAMGDRPLGIPGEELAGSHSTTEFVAWYNGHPDYVDRVFDLGHEIAVIVGNGNVALDVARILTSDPERLAATDIADHALQALREGKVREVVVVGRRGPLEAAFTTKELLGLAAVPGVDVVVSPDELNPDPASAALAGDRDGSFAFYKLDLMSELSMQQLVQPRRVTLRFHASAREIRGRDRVESIVLEHNQLREEGGRIVARGTGEFEQIPAGLLFRSVGYVGRSVPGVPFDEQRGVIPNHQGRVIDPDTADVIAGVYATGWIKRGPTGVIGSNKRCARETVGHLIADFADGRLGEPGLSGLDVGDLLPDHVNLSGWKRIDDHEREAGQERRRPRVKLVDVETMLTIARSVNSEPAVKEG